MAQATHTLTLTYTNSETAVFYCVDVHHATRIIDQHVWLTIQSFSLTPIE